jgi:hypothetical protein
MPEQSLVDSGAGLQKRGPLFDYRPGFYNFLSMAISSQLGKLTQPMQSDQTLIGRSF